MAISRPSSLSGLVLMAGSSSSLMVRMVRADVDDGHGLYAWRQQDRYSLDHSGIRR
jgi:hypothetical protein